MGKLIDELRRIWQGISQPSPLFGIGLAAACIALSTVARWCLSLIRPDVFFTPYFPAVFFATAFGGSRIGLPTAIAGRLLGGRFREACTADDFLGRVRPDDLGRRALPLDRVATTRDRQAPDQGRGIS